MFGIGGSEILVILVIALLFLGPDKLPEVTKQISKGIRDLKKHGKVLTQTIENDETIGGALRDIKSALRGDEIAAPIKKPIVNKIESDKIEGSKPAELAPAEAKPDAADPAKTTDVAVAKTAAQVQTKSVTLPPTAGESNAEDFDLEATHGSETIKREEPAASDDEPKLKHG